MLPYVFLLFVLMPIVEIAVLLNVGAVIGWIPTILIVILTAVLGTWMLRQQGLATMMAARQRMQAGEMPTQQIAEGMLLLVGGALLLTPGFVTDAVGFACLIPVTRKWIASYLARRGAGGFVSFHTGNDPANGPEKGPGAAGNGPFGRSGPNSSSHSGVHRVDPRSGAARGRNGGEVIEGEFERGDD